MLDGYIAKSCFKQRWSLSGEHGDVVSAATDVSCPCLKEKNTTERKFGSWPVKNLHLVFGQFLIYMQLRVEMNQGAGCKDCHFGLMFDDCRCRM